MVSRVTKRMFIAVYSLLIMSLNISSHANPLSSKQEILCPSFRTLEVRLNESPLLPAIMYQGSNDRIIISFDELSSEPRRLRYSLLHCSKDWTPSDLNASEYEAGFNDGTVDDISFSQATVNHYVHYRIMIPGDLNPLLPGNYLLTVTDENNPEEALIRARFSVCEQSIKIDGRVDGRTDMDYMKEHQQLTIEADFSQSEVENPYTDLYVTVEQNYRPETTVTLTSPTMVSRDKAIYEHLRELIFPGGNEYRRMEITDTRYPGMGVEGIGPAYGQFYATLNQDYPRLDERYVYDQTQHGRFIVREYNSERSDTEAEYVNVLFRLVSPELKGNEVHIEGDLTGRIQNDDSRMEYDSESGEYRKELLLKQGAYNYQYVTRLLNSNYATKNIIEGDNYQTNNEYLIKVYYRKRGDRYDRLGGISVINVL